MYLTEVMEKWSATVCRGRMKILEVSDVKDKRNRPAVPAPNGP